MSANLIKILSFLKDSPHLPDNRRNDSECCRSICSDARASLVLEAFATSALFPAFMATGEHITKVWGGYIRFPKTQESLKNVLENINAHVDHFTFAIPLETHTYGGNYTPHPVITMMKVVSEGHQIHLL